MSILTFIMVFLGGLWMGQHISFLRVGWKAFPLGIWYERWAFVHRFELQIRNIRVSFWLKDYGKEKTRWPFFWTFLPHYQWGTSGIYGTPHGDFRFPFCQYRGWGNKITKIE